MEDVFLNSLTSNESSKTPLLYVDAHLLLLSCTIHVVGDNTSGAHMSEKFQTTICEEVITHSVTIN